MSNALTKHSSDTEVAIVLCTYNGARYLEEQVKSLIAQEQAVVIFASDDGSSDDTAARLSDLLRPEEDSVIVQSTNQGYVQNFATTLKRALDSGASYFALSDQDDVWEEGRIAYGMQKNIQ